VSSYPYDGTMSDITHICLALACLSLTKFVMDGENHLSLFSDQNVYHKAMASKFCAAVYLAFVGIWVEQIIPHRLDVGMILGI